MQNIYVSAESFDKAWIGKVARTDHAVSTIQAPFMLRDAESKVLLAFAVSRSAEFTMLRQVLPKLKYSAARRTNGMLSRSATFGFMPREPLRRDHCRASAVFRDHPDVALELERIGKLFSADLLSIHPEQHAKQAALLSTVHDRWKMPDSVYTTGILNLNNPLVYHRDRGNFAGAWNAMTILRRDVSGGELVLPDYKLSINFRDGDAIWMNAAEVTHGVTPIIKTKPDGYRISVVYYALKNMCDCGTPQEELARVRTVKTKRARNRTTENSEVLREQIADKLKRNVLS